MFVEKKKKQNKNFWHRWSYTMQTNNRPVVLRTEYVILSLFVTI